MEKVTIQKLVHGGQGLGTLSDGRKCFVWGALPGETVEFRVTKKKSSFVEGIAEEIISPADTRVAPKEAHYLATSPWQILDFKEENKWKLDIVNDVFSETGIKFTHAADISDGIEYGYRNKMEYGFWGDEKGIHLAHFQRGSHNKIPVTGSALASEPINKACEDFTQRLNKLGVRAGDLKSVVFRASASGKVVASLFVKTESFRTLSLPESITGFEVWYSNPKSPASVKTQRLQSYGPVIINDQIGGHKFSYDVHSFFQVNLPMYEKALGYIKDEIDASQPLIDIFSGVGSIGLSMPSSKLTLIESDRSSATWARHNLLASGKSGEVIESPAERVIEYISSDTQVIIDPPRAGLHKNITAQLLEALPSRIVYLSCNPSTQARDIGPLLEHYTVSKARVFNFFPKTPHIESLVSLTRKNS